MTDEVVVNPAGTEVISFAPLGEVFSSARSAKKLALKDISNNLRLSIKQIEALENNDFSSLPPAMITRGFIRNYARLLELDAEPLLASYRARTPDAMPNSLSVKTSMNQVMQANKSASSSLKYILLGSLVLFFLAVWFYYTNSTKKPAQQAKESIVNKSVPEPAAEVAPLPEVALPVAEREAQTEVVDAQAAVNAAVENSGGANNKTTQALPSTVAIPPKVEQVTKRSENNPAANDSSVATQNLQLPKEAAVDFNALKEKAALAAKVPAANTASVKTASVNQEKAADVAKSDLKTESTISAVKSVNIAVSERTWVQVTDKTGAVVYEKMLQPNSQDGFNGLPPFKVLIGNAKGTKLTFLGQEVDLTDKTRNNVARVTLE